MADSPPGRCCRSSVVEHSLGKGEVDSSILSGSTIYRSGFKAIAERASPPELFPHRLPTEPHFDRRTRLVDCRKEL